MRLSLSLRIEQSPFWYRKTIEPPSSVVTYPVSEPSEPQISFTLYFSFMYIFNTLTILITFSMFVYCLVNEKTKTPCQRAPWWFHSEIPLSVRISISPCSGCLFQNFSDSRHACPIFFIAIMKQLQLKGQSSQLEDILHPHQDLLGRRNPEQSKQLHPYLRILNAGVQPAFL